MTGLIRNVKFASLPTANPCSLKRVPPAKRDMPTMSTVQTLDKRAGPQRTLKYYVGYSGRSLPLFPRFSAVIYPRKPGYLQED